VIVAEGGARGRVKGLREHESASVSSRLVFVTTVFRRAANGIIRSG
jgi:hypothetical protein